MTATIEVELGCLITKIDEAITISRKQMDYGWKEVGDTFFRSGTKVPVEQISKMSVDTHQTK